MLKRGACTPGAPPPEEVTGTRGDQGLWLKCLPSVLLPPPELSQRRPGWRWVAADTHDFSWALRMELGSQQGPESDVSDEGIHVLKKMYYRGWN